MQRCAHHRVDAVGTDEGRTRDRAGRGVHDDAVGAVPEVGYAATGVYRVGAETCTHRVEQHHLQPPTVHRQLRVGVARGQSAGFGEQQLAAMGVEADRRRGRGHGGQRVTEAELGEFADRVRQQVDPDSQRLQVVCAFQQECVESARVQSQGSGESADAGANDEYWCHDSSLGAAEP